MQIEVEGVKIQIKPINYADKLELKGHYADVYKDDINGVSVRDFYKLLGHCAEVAFNNPEESLKEHDDVFQTKILTASLMEYIGESKEAKKDNGG